MAGTNFADVEVSPRMVLVLRVLNAAGFLAVILTNYIGGPGPYRPGSASAKNPTPITPAGYTFSIWLLIYLLQAALWWGYQWAPQVNKGLVFGRIAFWHLATCVTNVSWIIIVSYNIQWPASALLWVQLVVQLVIYYRIHCVDGLSTAEVRAGRTWLEYFFVYLPWALYTSWALGASLIAIFVPLGAPEEDVAYYGLFCLAFAAVTNVSVLAWTKDVAFAAVNVWTFVGIMNAKAATLPLVAGAAFSLAWVVGAFAAFTWVVNVASLFRPTAPVAVAREPLLPTGL